jgi:CBS domain-containing protein
MAGSAQTTARTWFALEAETAADLMTPVSCSLRDSAGVGEALALLVDKGVSAAPVMDRSGKPVGVVSRADILVHYRERDHFTAPAGSLVKADPTQVFEIMTPAVFSIRPETPAAEIIEQLVALKVDRLFVVDDVDALLGAISVRDVLERLRPA